MAGLWQALQPLEVQNGEASLWRPEGPSAAGGGDPEEHRAVGALGAPSQPYFSGHGSELLLLPPLGNHHSSAAHSCRQPCGEAVSDGEGISYWAPFLCPCCGFPCWTSSPLHRQWELGGDAEQLPLSPQKPCSCRAAHSLAPGTASEAFAPSLSLLLPAPLASLTQSLAMPCHSLALLGFSLPCSPSLIFTGTRAGKHVLRGGTHCLGCFVPHQRG